VPAEPERKHDDRRNLSNPDDDGVESAFCNVHPEVLHALVGWARWVSGRVSLDGVFSFGSLISDDGRLFERERSDIDLLIAIPTKLDAGRRVAWCATLAGLVHELEVSLLSVLRRDDAGSPITSVLAVTAFELTYDVHKSRSQGFFSTNRFLRVDDGALHPPKKLSASRLEALPHMASTVVAEVQAARNRYLRVSPNGKRATAIWDDAHDALPKEICRAAAMARYVIQSPGDESQFNINEGLRFLMSLVHNEGRSELKELSDIILSRQGARGQRQGLTADHLLFLWELLFDRFVMTLSHPSVAPSTQTLQRDGRVPNPKVDAGAMSSPRHSTPKPHPRPGVPCPECMGAGIRRAPSEGQWVTSCRRCGGTGVIEAQG
ncbi:MAG: hypothetical protein CVU23_09450, partial [Betaproteobacteria bacterium HGW-Betaproteobacteria-17]